MISRLVLSFLTFTLMAFNVSAQTAFSFSGLKWGDNVESVIVQLAASGLPVSSLIEKVTCKVRTDCTLEFAGAVRGSASFQGGKLVEIMIYSENDPKAYAERASKLREKYGAPLPKPQLPETGRLADLIAGSLDDKWRSSYGETLQLGSGGFILYRSGAINDAQGDHSNRVKF